MSAATAGVPISATMLAMPIASLVMMPPLLAGLYSATQSPMVAAEIQFLRNPANQDKPAKPEPPAYYLAGRDCINRGRRLHLTRHEARQTSSGFRIDAHRASSGMTALILRFLPLHGLPADIAPAETVGPFDAVDRRIGARLRFGDGLAGRADIQHASAIGEDVAVLRDHAGMEDFDAFDLAGLIQPPDAGAPGVIAGIPLCRHHHRQRRFGKPAQVEILQ